MDEPLSNLDAKLRVQMRAEIAALQRELAVTTLYVTHDQIEAMTMGDRVAVLKDGRLQQVDTPQNLYDHPANVFVGAFIGSPSMTPFDSTIDLSGDAGTMTLGSNKLVMSPMVLEKHPKLSSYDGKSVIVGIRPEDYQDAARAPDVPDNQRITTKATLIEALGSEIIVHFRVDAPTVDSGDPDAIEETIGLDTANAVGRFDPRSTVKLGDTLEVAFLPENTHFFDPQTRPAMWLLLLARPHVAGAGVPSRTVTDPSTPAPDHNAPDNALARRAIGLIDLTDLADDHSAAGIDELCSRAKVNGTAAVCVWPEFVARCAANLSESAVRVATVVNFPTGEQPVAEVLASTRAALDAGADDIDLVLPYRAYLDGDVEYTGQMVAEVAALIEPPRLLKVMLETGELGESSVIGAAAALAIENGADFVKTSTGKSSSSATLPAASAMLGAIAEARTAGRSIGLKPSGGISSYEDAASYIHAAESVMGDGWATPVTFRFGASGLLDALLSAIDGSEQSAANNPNGY